VRRIREGTRRTTSILFLTDQANGSASGTVLPVDGGMHDLLPRPVD
jgi:hypothetical protein